MATTPDWGTPPWRVDVDIAPSAPPARCDVAVVGGGFTGLSAAYHLARRGVRVALLEASRLGSGASGRTGGIVLEGTAIGPLGRVENCLDALAAVVARERIACELRLSGCWELMHRRESDSRGRLWRDGDEWLYVSDTVPGGLKIGAGPSPPPAPWEFHSSTVPKTASASTTTEVMVIQAVWILA